MERLDAEHQVTHRVGPVRFVSTTTDLAASLVCASAGTDDIGQHIHLLNAYSIALADRDPAYRAAVSGAAINLPDGLPVSWVSRVRRDWKPLTQVRGVRFFLETFRQGQRHGVRHYLLGSREETLELLAANLIARFPDAEIVGTHSPPFRPLTQDELTEQDAAILKSQADVVWVGLGTPKQDFEVSRLASTLPVTAIAVGAAFDFVAGTAKEAPDWMSRAGLEWAYRLWSEPRRLWRRYVFGNIRFLAAVARPRRNSEIR